MTVGSDLASLPAFTEPRGVRLEVDGSLSDVPVDEAITAAQVSDRPVIVLARTGAEAEEFRREQGLSPRRTIYATATSVRGFTDYEIIMLPGFRERRDVDRIWHAMLPGLLCQRRLSASMPAAAVARVLRTCLRVHHGFVASGSWAADFLDRLAAEGYRVEPIEAPAFADVLPASVD